MGEETIGDTKTHCYEVATRMQTTGCMGDMDTTTRQQICVAPGEEAMAAAGCNLVPAERRWRRWQCVPDHDRAQRRLVELRQSHVRFTNAFARFERRRQTRAIGNRADDGFARQIGRRMVHDSRRFQESVHARNASRADQSHDGENAGGRSTITLFHHSFQFTRKIMKTHLKIAHCRLRHKL